MMRRVMCRAARQAVARPAMRWTSGLSEACGKELEDERSFFEDMEKPELPAGWSQTWTEGTGFFRMTKSIDGAEVMVDCEFKAHDAEEDSTGFSVIVTRNGVTADFTLRYTESSGSYTIEGMSTFSSRGTATDLTPQADIDRDNSYEGPIIEDLEKTEVVEKVIEYLSGIGIDSNFAAYVHKTAQVFEQQAYMKFLADLEKFAK